MQDQYTVQNFVRINCSLCNKEFIRSLSEYERGSGLRFCSIICRNRSLAFSQLSQRIPCPICGTLFYKGAKNQRKTCSMKCKLEKGRRAKLRICAHCGVEFLAKTPGSKVKFCSNKCVGLSHIRVTPHKCEHCGVEFFPETTTRKRRFCSTECRKAYMKGSNHPLWRGNRKHERGTTWKAAATAARLRDSSCVGCGYYPTNEQLSVDHIVPFRIAIIYSITDNTDPNDLCNLVCLCRSCHSKKTRIEHILLSGNLDEFIQRLSAIIPRQYIDVALGYWNIGSGTVANTLIFDRLPSYITEISKTLPPPRACLRCGEFFTPAFNNPNGQSCSPRCTMKLWRDRRKLAEKG